MKLLKLLFVFGLLHKSTIVAGQNAANKSVRVSLVKTLQSNRTEGCKCNDQPWKEGVDRFLKGIQEANANLCGTPLDRTKPINALLDYQTQLTSFTTSDSSILASSSTEILNSLSKCSKLGGSGRNIIVQFKNVFAAIVADFNKIAQKLSDHIAGDLICAFTDAVRDLSRVFLNYMTEVLYSSKKEIDNKSVLERLQNILNIVAHIGQTVNNCNSTKESQAGVTVLNWLSYFLENAVQGIGSCALEVQQHRRIQITTTIKKCDSCKCTSNKEPWKQQIDRFFKGIEEANEKLRGTPLDRTKPIDFLQDYITKLTSFTTSDSSILASSSTEILNAISQCGKVGGSGRNIIVQFKNVFPAIVEAVNEIARKLTDHIASDLIVAFTDAVSDFGCAFSNYMTEVLESQSFGRKKEVDFEPVLQRLQNILNIVAHIGQTVNNGNATQESQTAALVLNLITLFLGNAVEGIGACALEVQPQQSHLSPSCKSYSLSLNKALLLILKAVEAVVASLGVTVTEVLNVVTNVVSDLNSLFQNVFGLLNGVGSITKNLLKIF